MVAEIPVSRTYGPLRGVHMTFAGADPGEFENISISMIVAPCIEGGDGIDGIDSSARVPVGSQ
jgi:hypothetical protein